jgi:hypothetical protein
LLTRAHRDGSVLTGLRERRHVGNGRADLETHVEAVVAQLNAAGDAKCPRLRMKGPVETPAHAFS